MRRGASGLLLALCLAGCVDLSPDTRRHHAEQMAAAAGWESLRLPAGDFTLAAFAPREIRAVDTLTIYVEGDGLAWINRSQVSPDPTPLQPLALALALRQPGGTAVYLARPCQYVTGAEARHCRSAMWTGSRFSEAVVQASNVAIDQLKQRVGAQRVILVGYSGGGAVAALVAARRNDVALLLTVAGNLDTAEWVRRNRLSPLPDSLNPADAWPALRNVPQLHLVGGRDKNISPEVVRAYLSHFPPEQRPPLQVMDSFDHHCCWVDQWPALYPQPQGKAP